MRLYIYPPTAVSVTVPPIAYTDGGINTPVTPSTPLPVIEFPVTVFNFSNLNFADDNVDDSAYVELVASLPEAIKKIQVFMSSPEPLYLAIGAPGSESDKMIILPGGNGIIEFLAQAGDRLSVKAVNAVTVSDGSLIVNYIG